MPLSFSKDTREYRCKICDHNDPHAGYITVAFSPVMTITFYITTAIRAAKRNVPSTSIPMGFPTVTDPVVVCLSGFIGIDNLWCWNLESIPHAVD